ncbi:MAG: ATP-dependent protease, Lon family [Bacillota bacterium]|jgi:ATP-dependent Lon protease|nr:MAG: ATP-dependent protease, Lon family [Bacillota bacterium]
MKSILDRLVRTRTTLTVKLGDREQLRRQVDALFDILGQIYGHDKLVLRAGKLEVLDDFNSDDLSRRVLALQKLVYEDPTVNSPPKQTDIPTVLEEVEEEIADMVARRSVEDKLEKKIAERMQKRHEEYVRDIKLQIIKEDVGPENAQTLKKLAVLEKLEAQKLARTFIDVTRPTCLAEVVGQEAAIRTLLAKIACPFPQHVLLYGPPGVGKTTVARLVLEEARRLPYSPFRNKAPFVEVDGTTLRWDPREATNPLLGSVHDPIYQGARRELAEGGVPEPKLGLVTDAHGGILFIDEIGELEPTLLNKLLKVLEDKRVTFDSSYYDPLDHNVPRYVRKLFDEGAPADFVLIGATTRDPWSLNPALRSRCAEVYFEPLSPKDIQRIVVEAAAKLGVRLSSDLAELISNYTVEGRKAIGLLADAYGLALYRRGGQSVVRQFVSRGKRQPFRRPSIAIDRQDILDVIQSNRLTPNATFKASATPEVGRVLGLGASGYMGSVLEIEAVAFPARKAGEGAVRFNETAGTMTRDSVYNAASVVRNITGEELGNFDVHVNIVGGGDVDGPSAGAAIMTAIISAIKQVPVRQDTAVTGEISIRGRIKPVGGLYQKLYGARQSGVTTVVIPEDNKDDLPASVPGLTLVAAKTISEVLDVVLVPDRAEASPKTATVGKAVKTGARAIAPGKGKTTVERSG